MKDSGNQGWQWQEATTNHATKRKELPEQNEPELWKWVPPNLEGHTYCLRCGCKAERESGSTQTSHLLARVLPEPKPTWMFAFKGDWVMQSQGSSPTGAQNSGEWICIEGGTTASSLGDQWEGERIRKERNCHRTLRERTKYKALYPVFT